MFIIYLLILLSIVRYSSQLNQLGDGCLPGQNTRGDGCNHPEVGTHTTYVPIIYTNNSTISDVVLWANITIVSINNIYTTVLVQTDNRVLVIVLGACISVFVLVQALKYCRTRCRFQQRPAPITTVEPADISRIDVKA